MKPALMKRLVLAVAFSLAGFAAVANAAEAPGLPVTKAPAGAEVYIISPKDGATVGESVTVQFGLKGMGVAPAGVDKEKTGHHHLLVDVKDLPPGRSADSQGRNATSLRRWPDRNDAEADTGYPHAATRNG